MKGVKGSSSKIKRKSSKKKRYKGSSQVSKKKNSRRNKSRKIRRDYSSDSSYSDSDSVNSLNSSGSEFRGREKKSKKITRRDYLVSSYSDDDSRSLSSDPSNADSRSRKGVRSSKVDRKSRKRKARKRSTSPDTDEDSHRDRKRKRPDKKRDSKSRKKSLRKKRKRYSSVSSSSTDSLSCSTFRSSTPDNEPGKHNVKGKVELGRLRENACSHKERDEDRKCKVSSQSCPSFSRDSDHGVSHEEEILRPENNSRRLRSVIVVADYPQNKEENYLEKDLNEEEIVCDHDDYPSPRSIDSNDGSSERESDYLLHNATNKNVTRENVAELTVCDTDSFNPNHDASHLSDKDESDNSEKENKDDVLAAAPDLPDGDLESILRQKALENLRKFRGWHQPRKVTTDNMNIINESHIGKSSPPGAGTIQSKQTKHDDSNSVCMAREIDRSCMPMLKSNSYQPRQVKEDLSDGKQIGTGSRIPGQRATNPFDRAKLYGDLKEDSVTETIVTDRPVLDENRIQSVGAIACSSSTVEPSCSVKQTSGEHCLEEQQSQVKNGMLQNEAKDSSSQFEQKTMSVMRGGEMVQVSYKVYIPKRTPALARRQLRR